MATISKKSDAPEGPIKLSIGMTHLEVDGPVETDDLLVIETIRNSFSGLLDVTEGDSSDPEAAARRESDALNALSEARDAAKRQHAEKDPQDPAAPIPTSIDDLEEAVAERERIEAETKARREAAEPAPEESDEHIEYEGGNKPSDGQPPADRPVENLLTREPTHNVNVKTSEGGTE